MEIIAGMKSVTIKSNFFKDMGILLGRSMRHLSGSGDTFALVVIMHIVMMLLLICVSCCAISARAVILITCYPVYCWWLLPGKNYAWHSYGVLPV